VARIPLIEDLTRAPIPAGSNILVEFDPASQWVNASLTMGEGWLKTGGRLNYIAEGQPPDEVRSRLKAMGLNVEELERNDWFWLTDFYTAGTVGQKSKERFHVESLKVADMSIWMGKEVLHEPPAPDFLVIADNQSVLDRFNEEENWVELTLSRIFPMGKSRLLTQIGGILGGGVHSQWAYKQLEAAADGVVDFKLEDEGKTTRDLIRVRNMRNVHFDRDWHELKVGDNFEVTLAN
jgi:KaiC/GvpD/RAD55 family RecA-like ATPase